LHPHGGGNAEPQGTCGPKVEAPRAVDPDALMIAKDRRAEDQNQVMTGELRCETADGEG
jgi:hypothetical protein